MADQSRGRVEPASEPLSSGRIGPNAVLQLIPALADAGGQRLVERVFAEAAASDLLEHPPQTMVDQARVRMLFAAVQQICDPPLCQAIMTDAGTRTGAYILANRIPALAQSLLKRLPVRLARRLLAFAIAKNAWTFAGTGRVTIFYGRPLVLSIADNPIAIRSEAGPSACVWHEAVISTLFRALAGPDTVIRETHCCAAGDSDCRFEIGSSR